MEDIKAEREYARVDADALETLHQKQKYLMAQTARIYQGKRDLLSDVDAKVTTMALKVQSKFKNDSDPVAPILEQLKVGTVSANSEGLAVWIFPWFIR